MSHGVEIIDISALPWQPSPTPTVHRKRLYHAGPPEAGVVTSIVRYDAGSTFPRHDHPGGEEIFVLDGVFEDEHGRYPPGTYLFNPEGFSHAPFSREGCEIFVRLRQSPGPRQKVMIDTQMMTWDIGSKLGVEVLPLYRESGYPEEVHLTRLRPGVEVGPVTFPNGEEIFVVEGTLVDEYGTHDEDTFLRFPPGSTHTPTSPHGAVLFVKKGHLPLPTAG